MLELSMHILDIAENSVSAGADEIHISVEEEEAADRLIITISDNGAGMDDVQVARALDPFHTTKSGKQTGLGLPLLAEAASKAGGEIEICSKPGAGTTVTAGFQRSHVDRQPLGSMLDTLLTLIIGNPGVVFSYFHRYNEKVFAWNSKRVTRRLQAGNGTMLDLMKTIETELLTGIESLNAQNEDNSG